MIKLEKILSRPGFTKKQQEEIFYSIIAELYRHDGFEKIEKALFTEFAGDVDALYKSNNNKDLKNILFDESRGDFIIKVKNTTCIFTLANNIYTLLKFLDKIKIKITSDILEDKIITVEELHKINNKVIFKTPDNFITDGNIAIKAEHVFCDSELSEIKETIKNILPGDFISIKNYKKTIYKGHVYFYKSKKDFFVIDKKYYNVIKNFEIYFNKENKVYIALKNNEIIALCMGLLILNNEEEKINIIPHESDSEEEKIYTLAELVKEEKTAVKIEKEEILIPDNCGHKKEEKISVHKNAVSGHVYSGNNAEILSRAGYPEPLWVGRYQAKKLNKQVKADARGFVIRVYYEDDSGRSFCKLETIYNIAELEPIEKIENTSDFKNMIERLKRA